MVLKVLLQHCRTVMRRRNEIVLAFLPLIDVLSDEARRQSPPRRIEPSASLLWPPFPYRLSGSPGGEVLPFR